MKIRQIIPTNDLGHTPARVNRRTGVVYINNYVWDKLPAEAQKFILLHEEGHFVKQTKNELEADAYATYNYAGTEPMSLKKIARTIRTTLDPEIPQHRKRIDAVMTRLLIIDWLQFNNQQAKKILQKWKPHLYKIIWHKIQD